MKLAGKKLEGPNVETIVLPRGDGEPIVFYAQAIMDFEPFDQLCPRPKAPTVVKRGGAKSQNTEDPNFKKSLDLYARKRFAWIILNSLRQGTPTLEWEKVDYSDQNTWLNYEGELRESGFSDVEIGRIHRGCLIANALDDDKLDEARNAFLLSQQALADPSSSPEDGQNSMGSGEPANV